MSFNFPIDTHIVGDPLHTAEHNNLVDILSALFGSKFNVLNTGYAGGADPSGLSDSSAAIQAAMNAVPSGGVLYVPPGVYSISATLQSDNLSGSSVPRMIIGPNFAAMYGNARAQNQPATATFKVANAANLNAVFSDTAYSGVAGNPAPSSGMALVGLDIDCNGSNQSAGNGHGIAMITQASVVTYCRIRNSRGDGIRLTDTSAAGNTTTGGSVAALNENKVLWNDVGSHGQYGIYIASAGSLGTDGFLRDNIVDGAFANTAGFAAIAIDLTADWKVRDNHVYAQQGDGYHLYRASGGTLIDGNFADNFGGASVNATTYYGFRIQPTQFGTPHITNNTASAKEALGAGAGTFVYYDIENFSTNQNCEVYFPAGSNSARQISVGTGTPVPYKFASTGSGSLAVRGVTSPLTFTQGATPSPAAVAANVSGTVTFPDFNGPTARSTPALSASTASTTLVMAGYAIAFTPKATGNVRFLASGNAATQTAQANVGLGVRFGTGTAPVAGAAVTGTVVGVDQTVRPATFTTGVLAGFAVIGEVTGLTPGTAYWFDFAYDTSAGADVAQIGNISALLQEVA